MINAIIALLGAMPQILKLIKNIQEEHKKQEVNKKVKEDLDAINKAFETRDAQLLNDVFNGMPNNRRNDKD